MTSNRSIFALFAVAALLVAGSAFAQAPQTPIAGPLGDIPSFEGGGSCDIINLQGPIASGFLSWNAPGAGLAILVDPTGSGGPGDPGCGGGDFGTQNFRVDSVTFDLADEAAFGTGSGVGDADWSITIHEFATAGDPCSGPGAVLWDSGTQTLNMNGSGQYFPNIPVGIEIDAPVFVQWNLLSLSNAAETTTPLWDNVARPLCTQFVSQDGGGSYLDFTNFFIGGDTGWVDVLVNGEFVTPAAPSDIPTLGTSTMIGLVALLALLGAVALRQRLF